MSDTLGPQEVPGLFVDQNVITGAAGKGKEKLEQAGDMRERGPTLAPPELITKMK